MRRAVVVGGIVGALLGITLPASAAKTAPSTKAKLRAKLLSVSDLPAGWSVDNAAFSNPASGGGCLAAIKNKVPSRGTKVGLRSDF